MAVPQPWARQKRVVYTFTPEGASRYDAMTVTYFPEQNQFLVHQAGREWDLPWWRSKDELREFLAGALTALDSFDVDPRTWSVPGMTDDEAAAAVAGLWGLLAGGQSS